MINWDWVNRYANGSYHAFGGYRNEGPYLEPALDEKEIISKYKELLLASMKRSLEKAKNPTFTYSTGLDSSALYFIAGTHNSRFTSEFTPDVFEFLEEAITKIGEPFPTITWMMHYLLCQKVANMGYKSLFHGMGSDEINAGEYEFFPYFFADLWNDRKLCSKEIDAYITYHSTEEYPKSMESVCAIVAPILQTPAYDGYLKNKLLRAFHHETLPVCLRAIEKNTKIFGLESFGPYLDKDLVEFMFKVPATMKIKNGLMKHIHREAMKGILPEDIRTKVQKSGWNAPANVFTYGKGAMLLSDIVASKSFKERGLYDIMDVQRRIDFYEDHPNNKDMMFFWQLINLELWLRGKKDVVKKTHAAKTVQS